MLRILAVVALIQITACSHVNDKDNMRRVTCWKADKLIVDRDLEPGRNFRWHDGGMVRIDLPKEAGAAFGELYLHVDGCMVRPIDAPPALGPMTQG